MALTMTGILLSVVSGGEGLLIGIIIILLVLPAMQLGAALVTAVILGLSNRPDKRFQAKQLGKIVLGVLAGTFIGIVLMVVIAAGLGAFH